MLRAVAGARPHSGGFHIRAGGEAPDPEQGDPEGRHGEEGNDRCLHGFIPVFVKECEATTTRA
jgi:hypothetical protein